MFCFKQFTIHQDRTAMKVCTDSCLFGAWTTQYVKNAGHILDIGTGTGLLPLMLAQKSTSSIDTIESDPDAAGQAAENIEASPWANRIRVLKGDATRYSFPHRYDFIISNPPFYASDLKSPEQKKNMAKHDDSLTMEALMKVINENLKPAGIFSLLFPYARTDEIIRIAESHHYFPIELLTVRQTPRHSPFRSIALFGRNSSEKSNRQEMMIKDDAGNYTEAFTGLLNDYYL